MPTPSQLISELKSSKARVEEPSTTQESPPPPSKPETRTPRLSTSSLEEKARKLREQEAMLAFLVQQSQSNLREIQERVEETDGYVAVRRTSNENYPPRKRIDMPELPPSPIPDSARKDRSVDEIDEHFTQVLKSTPPSSSKLLPRPPLAPFNRHSQTTIDKHIEPLAASRPLLRSPAILFDQPGSYTVTTREN
jgi:hypothetical protein